MSGATSPRPPPPPTGAEVPDPGRHSRPKSHAGDRFARGAGAFHIQLPPTGGSAPRGPAGRGRARGEARGGGRRVPPAAGAAGERAHRGTPAGCSARSDRRSALLSRSSSGPPPPPQPAWATPRPANRHDSAPAAATPPPPPRSAGAPRGRPPRARAPRRGRRRARPGMDGRLCLVTPTHGMEGPSLPGAGKSGLRPAAAHQALSKFGIQVRPRPRTSRPEERGVLPPAGARRG